jgi:hypothetical protein
MNAPAPTAIQFELRCYWWWQPLFYVCKPIVQLDGSETELTWGTHRLPASIGSHEVAIYFPYMGRSECGLAKITVDVGPGQTRVVSYSPPFTIFQPGKIQVA